MSSSLIPRREQRHLLPFSSVLLQAELIQPSFCYMGYLWDVSGCGACLCFSEDVSALTCDETLQVRFCWAEKNQAITTPCRVVWFNSIHGACFVGVEFIQSIDLSTTFFADLLNPKFLSHSAPN